MWNSLANYESTTGGKVLAIPHNGNLSNGMMFMLTTIAGEAFDKDYVARRAKWEPLYEATQIKGDAEAHPFLSPDDEFADSGTWDRTNLDYSQLKNTEMLPYEYARSALKLGLKIKQELGTSPYKFGIIGSTDSHTSLTTADDNNFFDKASNVEPSASRVNHTFVESRLSVIKTRETLASGYAAVWAQENTRASLWDAMKREETYATTGPSSPSFIVAAMQDPEGGSLDRIQIIKGWLKLTVASKKRSMTLHGAVIVKWAQMEKYRWLAIALAWQMLPGIILSLQ